MCCHWLRDTMGVRKPPGAGDGEGVPLTASGGTALPTWGSRTPGSRTVRESTVPGAASVSPGNG